MILQDKLIIFLKKEIKRGVCYVFIPHTTAAVTINENADPDVVRDILMELDKIVPLSDDYHHYEGNSAAHIKSSMMGFSETILVEEGALLLEHGKEFILQSLMVQEIGQYMLR